jgi:hypothetical protein
VFRGGQPHSQHCHSRLLLHLHDYLHVLDEIAVVSLVLPDIGTEDCLHLLLVLVAAGALGLVNRHVLPPLKLSAIAILLLVASLRLACLHWRQAAPCSEAEDALACVLQQTVRTAILQTENACGWSLNTIAGEEVGRGEVNLEIGLGSIWGSEEARVIE